MLIMSLLSVLVAENAHFTLEGAAQKPRAWSKVQCKKKLVKLALQKAYLGPCQRFMIELCENS